MIFPCWRMIAGKCKNTLFSIIKPLYFYNNRGLCCVYKNTVIHTIQYSWLWGEGFWAVFLGSVWCGTQVSHAVQAMCSVPRLQWSPLMGFWWVIPETLWVHYMFDFELIFGGCVQTPYTVVKVSGASPQIQLCDRTLRIYDRQGCYME